ncbi:MAG: hypothetical protein HKO58_08365, partial [Gammaproteobacteria bacterium]|nr:hypothetical protein [Gammaproteobacteria bacterium]
MTRSFVALPVFALAMCLACTKSSPLNVVYHPEQNPALLSDWKVIQVKDQGLQLGNNVMAYDLVTPLFSDYAHKLRTVWLPEGTAANYTAPETFDFPVGTIISKTFYYPRVPGSAVQDYRVMKADDTSASRLLDGFDLNSVRLIETRLLIHREQGWVALPYVWNAEQSEARLQRTGAIQSVNLLDVDGNTQTFPYIVPNTNQCVGCHATNATTKTLHPIGPKARHLNKSYAYRDGEQNQLEAWKQSGILTGLPEAEIIPANADWTDSSQELEQRARAYLDINCSHCHNQNGPADTSGLLLEPDAPHGPSLGLCKLPIAAGTGTGDRKFGIVP